VKHPTPKTRVSRTSQTARIWRGPVALALAAAWCWPAWAAPAVAPTTTTIGTFSVLPSAPSLSCKRVALTLVPDATATCGTWLCGPGSTPGMSQVLGTTLATATTGLATVGAYDFGSRSKWVSFNVSVPDLRSFAPTTIAVAGVKPLTSRLWIIKSDTLPGAEALDVSKTHVAGDLGHRYTGYSNTLGAKRNSTWQLIGQVSATAVVGTASVAIQYAFACVLPVVDNTIVVGP
jgi:hypothetical protein